MGVVLAQYAAMHKNSKSRAQDPEKSGGGGGNY
jgi:hypothetical protein